MPRAQLDHVLGTYIVECTGSDVQRAQVRRERRPATGSSSAVRSSAVCIASERARRCTGSGRPASTSVAGSPCAYRNQSRSVVSTSSAPKRCSSWKTCVGLAVEVEADVRQHQALQRERWRERRRVWDGRESQVGQREVLQPREVRERVEQRLEGLLRVAQVAIHDEPLHGGPDA